MSNVAQSKLRKDVRNMPSWVSETNDRIGPKPPPPPLSNGRENAPALPPKSRSQTVEPDYEIIEFCGQQYSNEPMRTQNVVRTKTPESKLKCTLCGSNNPWVTCSECSQQIFCASCDDMYHKHPKRKNHIRKAVEQNSRPPLPPKTLPGQPGQAPPVAPPRRSKRGLMTPLLQRKEQVMNSPMQAPPSPTPSMKSTSWQDRMGSLKRGMNLMNRPLPDPPKMQGTPSEAGHSSRSTTPRSAFDIIQRPPSVTMEKIKSKASATLDKMALLQQRYRQHKNEQERNRSDSVNSQNLSFDQWANISSSPSNFRSGSMSSGLNSSHFDLSDDSHFHLFNQRQQTLAQQQQPNRPRNMSTSVFNLNQINRRTSAEGSITNGWAPSNQMQQAQSMAQLNCAGCNHMPHWNAQHIHDVGPHMPMDDFHSHQQLNRSNLSLNMPAGAGFLPPSQHFHHGYPPPVFMNARNNGVGMMYPYAYAGGMPVMNPGVMGMPPPSRSRATSRAGSRAVSPAMSRKSVTMRRKHSSNFTAADDDATDDEDSEQDDRRSLISNRSYLTGASRSAQRPRRLSGVSQQGTFDDIDSETLNNRNQHNMRSNYRENRRGSAGKPVKNDWVNTTRRQVQSLPNKIYSDLDSEGSGTRALVQAKIQEKLEQSAKKTKTRKRSTGSESTEDKKKPTKVSTEVQAGIVRHKSETVKAPAKQNETKNLVQNGSEEETDENIEESQNHEELSQENDDDAQAPNEVPQNTDAPPITAEEEGEGDDLGPPPSTPNYEWECEFCTFVNEPNIKICTICCKTPSKSPKKYDREQRVIDAVPSKKSSKDKNAEPSNAPKFKNTKQNSATKVVTNGVSKLKVTSSENDSDQHNEKQKSDSSSSGRTNQKSNHTQVPKESVEDIWAALDENIQSTADEILRKADTKKSISKVSTSCGTSPPPSTKNESIRKAVGTSPPPQSISTQTYDVLPAPKANSIKDDDLHIQLQGQALNNSLNYEHHAQSFSMSPLDNKISSWSPLEPLHPTQNERNLDFYHDKGAERFRSINDLRYSDLSSMESTPLSNGLGRRQSSYAELMTLQRAPSQLLHTPAFNNFGAEMPRYDPKPARDPETELYILLKEAELYKFTPEELHAAIKNCGPDTHPIQWLRDNWSKLIQTVRSLATKYGQERIENTVGTISQQEARDALRMHGGNIWQAVSECIEQRQRKYRDISSKGNFSREDIVTALTAHQGNVDMALMDLGRTQLKPFLMRIWGSPGGVENESGANIFLQSPQSPLSEINSNHDQMKSEIHEFLSANASECIQTPLSSGAFMQDFHSPIQTPDSGNLISNIDAATNHSNMASNYPDQSDETNTYNRNMLKDLETLIGNMESNQAKQNKEVLQSIEGMLEQLLNKRENDISNERDNDTEANRILMKSPITTAKSKISPKDNETVDIKTFVWQNIQEIVPSLVQQVKAELGEQDTIESSTPSNREETEASIQQTEKIFMEEIIQPNLKEASIREELPPDYIYAAEISNFRMEFDRGVDREHEQEYEMLTLEDAIHNIFKMFTAPTEIHPRNLVEGEEVPEQKITNIESDPSNAKIDGIAEGPSTSKAAKEREESNRAIDANKKNKSTAIPKLQDNLQKETKENTSHKQTESAENFINNNSTSNEKLSSGVEKRLKISKIPVRRSASSTSIRSVKLNIGGVSASHTQAENQSKTILQPPVDDNTTNGNRVDSVSIESETSTSTNELSNQANDEFFQDLDEISSGTEIESAELSKDLNASQTKESNAETLEDYSTSGEEELFSAGSDSVQSVQQQISDLSSDDVSKILEETENTITSTLIAEIPIDQDSSRRDFSVSSETSKQNLSELVQDTQRLIKQMKDEITLDEFESTDDDEYSEEYSDEYDDTEEDEGDWEAEEDDDDDGDIYDIDEEVGSIFDEEEDRNHSSLEIEIQGPSEDDKEKNEKDIISEDKMETQTDTSNNTQTPSITGKSTPSFEAKHNQPVSPENPANDIESSHNDNVSSISEAGTELQSPEPNSEALDLTFIETENSTAEMPAEIIFEGPEMVEDIETLNNTTDNERMVLEPSADSKELPSNLSLESENNITALQTTLTTISGADEPASNQTEVLKIEEALEILSENTPIISLQIESTEVAITSPDQTTSSQSEQNRTTSEFTPTTSGEIKVKIESIDMATTSSTQVASSQNDEIPIASTEEENVNVATSSAGQETSSQKTPVQDSIYPEQQYNAIPQLSEQPGVSANKISTAPSESSKDTQTNKRSSSKIPKPKDTSKAATKKAPLRSKSFSGPPTPIGISSVKTIQQQYLKNQSKLTVNASKAKTPAPPIIRKNSITEAINKLTKPPKENFPTKGTTPSHNGPNTSSGLFKPRTQMRIPKKKYHETCFSDDDYETTSAEEESEPSEIRERKRSVPVFRTYPSIQEPEEISPELLARKFMDDNLVSNMGEAHIAAALVNMKFQQDVSLWAAKECSDLDQAIALLQQECELCMGTYPLNEIVSMLKCTHKCCKQCAKSYFTVQITDRSINDCNCPFCKIPELHDQDRSHEDDNLEYFSNLDIFLKNILDTEVHELFQRKLRDRTLLQDPNFKWCVQCSSGFFARPKQKRLICPDCGSVTCAQCRKRWEKQHEGISCDQFQAWKDANDPEVQAQGVQEHLAQNGIDCPKCKFRYSLARGGCMHFTCTQCKFEFCYGCTRPFMMGAKCNVSPYCAKLGLHAHHPRNCLFYLRDKLPLQLQFLLKENGIQYDVDPLNNENLNSNSSSKSLCPIPLQKETPTGLVDTVCNGDVPENHAGMCRTHYVEYLTAKVAKAGIDPLPIFDLTDCVQELRRRGIALPERGPWDTDEIYKNMCAEVIRKNIPLESS